MQWNISFLPSRYLDLKIIFHIQFNTNFDLSNLYESLIRNRVDVNVNCINFFRHFPREERYLLRNSQLTVRYDIFDKTADRLQPVILSGNLPLGDCLLISI